MDKLFNMDNPVMRALSRMCDMMILNILALILCIPVVTAGASLTAMYYVELKWVRKQEGYLVKPFFREFKANFKQATAEWLIMLLVGLILYMDFSFFRSSEVSFPTPLVMLVTSVGLVLYFLMQWILPVQCHFENTVRQTITNSFLMAIANFPRTLGMGAVWAASVALAVLSVTVFLQIFPIVMLFGLTGPGYVVCALVNKPFRRLEPEEEEEPEEETEEEKEEAYRILREESAVGGSSGDKDEPADQDR